MAKPNFESVDAYLAAQPEANRRALERVRRAIRAAVPNALELISYNIPTVKLLGGTLLHFAGWKHYYSIYPANSRMIAAFGDELRPYLVEKSTLRFPFSEAVPTKLIERIAAFRAGEIRARQSATAETRRER